MNGSQGGALLGMTSAQWEQTKPALTRDNELVISVWNFCEGWNPDRVPAAVAFFGVDDMDALMILLLALRKYMEARPESKSQ